MQSKKFIWTNTDTNEIFYSDEIDLFIKRDKKETAVFFKEDGEAIFLFSVANLNVSDQDIEQIFERFSAWEISYNSAAIKFTADEENYGFPDNIDDQKALLDYIKNNYKIVEHYMYDKDNNKVNLVRHTLKKAIAMLASLVKCNNCEDCADCEQCVNCFACRSCKECVSCMECYGLSNQDNASDKINIEVHEDEVAF